MYARVRLCTPLQVIEVHLPQSSRSHARASFDGRHTMRMLVGVLGRAAHY